MGREALYTRIGAISLFLGPATTLAISPFSNFDPINLIKMIIVSGCAFSIFALLVVDVRMSLSRLPKGLWITAGFFLIWMSLVMFVSPAPINQQFWGVFGRNNGYLSYFCLVVLLLGVAVVQKLSFYRKLVEALVLTAIPTTAYALLQTAGLDPIEWSLMAPFATLGNINFSSAFFGLASLSASILALSPKMNPKIRISLMVLVLTDLWIILYTGSIQGFMIFVAGLGIALFFYLRSFSRLSILRFPYLVFGIAVFVLAAIGLKDYGPLARFIFGETVLFRFDYWFAGWAMTISNPVFGVGMDSYGDWYREVRGEIATLRTGPDRITNTAHNIYLDISASGGFPLIISYIFLLGFSVRACIVVFRRNRNFDPYFVALVSTWLAYLIQAAISINQIGVGVWGWLFSGAVIGYEVCTRGQLEAKSETTRSKNQHRLPASAALLSIVGFGVGVLLAFIPFNADAKFKEALQSGDVSQQFTQSKALGATAFHMELTLDAAIKANNEPLAAEVVREIIQRYPRDFMAWRVLQILTSSTPSEREDAYERLKELDPYNSNVKAIN